ncbi:O-methylsterigmatocystin oxidoreductase [Leucoagaricus sp. SymC.cos]|nr:O-methylsterigmatocystin oxidoreductase [Leucoagaricus sp. SymC.cos]
MDRAVLALGGAWIIYLLSRTRGGTPLPPGPRPLPLFGNMFQIPQKDEWPIYEAWAKEYGPITYLTMLRTPMIVLSSLKVIRDLMDERSGIYSNRPLMAMKKLCDLDWVLTYISGEPHQIRRTIVRRYFSGPASVKHRYYQQQESRVLVANLLKRPDDLEDHIKEYTSNAILVGTYGYPVSGADDPIVHEMERSFKQAERLNGPMAFLIEVCPNLKNWPIFLSLSGLNRILDEIKKVFTACRVDPFERTKQKIDDGTAVPCFVSTSLDDIASEASLSPDEINQKEELIMDCASVMYGAASDSRAQEDIDRVTEGERLPTFDDRERLPYIIAIILEVLRYNTVTPLGLPHGVAIDDIYNGMLIPEGSMICANLWLIFRDPKIFTNPDTFNPERFLGDEGAQCREVLNLAWGFGRRSCPGRQFAEAALFITISSVIACFNMTPKPLPTGEVPKLTFHDGFIRRVSSIVLNIHIQINDEYFNRRPKTFPMIITPRSNKWAELVDN